jgi:protein CpxP
MHNEQSRRNRRRLDLRTQIHAPPTDAHRVERDARLHTRMARDPDRMPDRLDFNDGQVTQIKALFDEQRRNPELTRTRLRERIVGLMTDEQWAIINDPRRPD